MEVIPVGGDVVVYDVHTPGSTILNLAVDGEHWYRSPPDFKQNSKDPLASKTSDPLASKSSDPLASKTSDPLASKTQDGIDHICFMCTRTVAIFLSLVYTVAPLLHDRLLMMRKMHPSSTLVLYT